ncbi:hypothetical protein ANANG_G00210060 [Anguilla anguilla]|uniref:Uncharacterized protein n=1 Tax=Anguilla anguilla TaxID=7936 RepID=A0A9D3M6V6_ANGAN|nr:hypothetical protein ANANG_G00210060 [Anguilla anguilla]
MAPATIDPCPPDDADPRQRAVSRWRWRLGARLGAGRHPGVDRRRPSCVRLRGALRLEYIGELVACSGPSMEPTITSRDVVFSSDSAAISTGSKRGIS